MENILKEVKCYRTVDKIATLQPHPVNGGTFFAGPEQADFLAKSRLLPKGPEPSALAMKNTAINAAIFYEE